MTRTNPTPADVATPDMLRTLRYVRILESQGVHCTLEGLFAFAQAKVPEVVLRDNFESHEHRYLMMDHHYEAVNTVGEYLIQVGWVESTHRGVELTKLGRAIDDNSGNSVLQPRQSHIINVVLKGNDPLSYVEFLEAIQRTGSDSEVMLIDPFLPSAHVPALMDSAGVTRVLTADVEVRDASESREKRTSAFGLMLGARDGRGLEIRFAKKGTIHDRLVIPEKGTGLMLGRSLGGRQMTAVVEMNENMTSLLREYYAPVWAEASAVPAVDLSHLVDDADDSGSDERAPAA